MASTPTITIYIADHEPLAQYLAMVNDILDYVLEIPGAREQLQPKVDAAKAKYREWKRRRIEDERGGINFNDEGHGGV